MAEIVNISYIGSGNESQAYSQKDDALITNSFLYTKFGDPNDSVEYFVYDVNGNVLDSVYGATSFKPDSPVDPVTGLYSSVALDPKGDLESRGFNRGTLNVQYNFLRNLFRSAYGKFYWIKEVSPSRTEIKIASQNISNTDILAGFNQYQAYITGLNYYNDFYLNFGNNRHIIAINVAYTEDADGSYLLIKLYEPLPTDLDVKDQLWIVEKIAESATYNVDIQVEAKAVAQQNVLRGPNFNVKTDQKVAQSTPYYSYSGLFSTNITGSFQKMLSYYQDRAININVDYSDFSNFVHFSSAASRVNNFVYKLTTIEGYNSQISSSLAISGGLSNPSVSSSVTLLKKSIDDVITNFDTYEYYLYFASESFAWPKSNSSQPYSLYSVTSSQAISWLGSETTTPLPGAPSILYSASLYDATNKDLLSNTIPQYLLDDGNNAPYVTFVNMIGQMFDNVWLYYKDVTNRFDATNNPSTGISPDLVADALIDLGTTLYTNTNVSDNLYYSMFGINQDGSLLPPTGSEKITSYVTSSLTTLPANDIQKEIYKRIYHNIPYLYKTKGTRPGLTALVNIYGIPNSILNINEFGGYTVGYESGLDSVYNSKVLSVSTPQEINDLVLTPSTTVQYYSSSLRPNSKNLELGFSPADSINNTIFTDAGYVNIDQLIGDPQAQYSASYPDLDQYERNFFSGYSYTHDMYEYVRLLKYFDNSLFKLAQDYVPARSNLSRGLIVKSHLLERNRYERHEPEMDASMNYSQSIETVTISGTDAPELQYPTSYNSMTQYTVTSPYTPTGSSNVYGPVSMSHTYAWEKYTGEYGGSEIEMVTDEFSQLERSSIATPWTSSVAGTSSMFTYYNDGALYNNAMNQVKSKIFSEAEYSYGIGAPINMSSLISESACQGCNRLYCFNYTLTSYTGSDVSFIYQDCNNNEQSGVLPSGSSAYYCGKPGSLAFPSNTGFSSYSSSISTTCGSTYSDVKYCYYVTVHSYTFPNLYYSYTDCTGSIVTGAIANNRSASFCLDITTLNFSAPVGSPIYTMELNGLCLGGGDLYSPYGYDCTILSQIKYGSGVYSASYTRCNGTTASYSGTSPGSHTDAYDECIRYSTLVTTNASVITTGSACGIYNKAYDPCTKLKYISMPAMGGDYTVSYYKCNGALTILTGSLDPLGFSLTINDCVRYPSLHVSPTPVEINTGSLCGYYDDPNQYTGSRDLAEIQDYNYFRTSTVNSRYAGAKYTNQDPTEDWKFGAIYEPRDYYVDYTGLFTSVESSSYFPDQMVAKMSYLADLSGGLQELNLKNNNWVYFQNMYKPGDKVTIKQFNATQYSNQKYLDKKFTVVESGYSYPPYWYRNSGSTECYSIVDGGSSLYSPTASYAKIIGNTTASFTSSAFEGSYKDARRIVYYNPSGVVKRPDSSNPYWAYPVISTGSYTPGAYNLYNISMYAPDSSQNSIIDLGGNLYSFSSGSQYNYISGSYYQAPIDGIYKISSTFNFSLDLNPVSSSGTSNIIVIDLQIIKWNGSSVTSGFVEGEILNNSDVNRQFKLNSGSFGIHYGNINTNTGYVLLSAGDKVSVKLLAYYNAVSIPTGTIDLMTLLGFGFSQTFEQAESNGTLCIDSTTANHQLFNTGSYTLGTDSLVISSGMEQYLNEQTTYLPDYSSTSPSVSESPLYSIFGDVNYTTQIEEGDYMILYYKGSAFGLSTQELYPISRRITSVNYTSGSGINLKVYPNMPGFVSGSNLNSFYKAVFTKRIPDETVMTLQGKKRPGQTSYGFVVPKDINPTIESNINTLQSTIQSQILNY